MCPLVFEHVEHSIYKHTTVESLFIEADLYQAITLHGHLTESRK